MSRILEYEFGKNEPIAQVVEFLEKTNNEKLASQLLDVYVKYSNQLEQFNLLTKLYHDIRDNVKAEKLGLKVLELAPSPEAKYNVRANLAKMFNLMNSPEKALEHITLNRQLTPNDPDTLMETVFSLYLLNRKAEAEVILRDLKKNQHLLPTQKLKDLVDFNLGTYDMEQGKFLEGLAGFLLNTKKLELWFSTRELPYKYWNGEIIPGKTVIMFMEGGGIGDEFIAVRFMDHIKAKGMRPVFYTGRKDMYDIFNRCGYETVLNIDAMPQDAMWIYAMHVPLALQLNEQDVKRSDPYLYPSQQAIDKFADMKQSKKFKIGVRWQGNAKNERDLHRQVKLDDVMTMLKDVYKDKNVEFYSLQIEDTDGMERYPELLDISDRIKSYDDTFALLQNLDLVVTSCTSVLHAAALTGTETLGLIPISAYFTWLTPCPNRTTTWYGDNLKLFRQVTPKKWDEPIAEMKQYLLEE